jgi:hypothetical protein
MREWPSFDGFLAGVGKIVCFSLTIFWKEQQKEERLIWIAGSR